MGTQEQRYAFAQQVMLRLAKSGAAGSAVVRYDRDEFALTVGNDHVLFLSNLFHETDGLAEAERDARVDRFVTALLSPKDPDAGWDEVCDSLRPILRPMTYGLGADDDMPQPLARPAFPFINEMVAIDREETRTIVTMSDAAKWGVPVEEVFARARANLGSILTSAELEPRSLIRFVDEGSSYFASYLLVPEWLAALDTPDWRPVAFIPDVDTLLLVPDDPEILDSVFEMVEQQYREASRPLSPQGYTLDGNGAVVPLDRVGPHRALAAAQRAAAGLAVTEYTTQSEWISEQFDTHLELTGFGLEPAYPATPLFVARDEGPFTVATWGQGVEFLLPRADYIVFCVMDEQEEEVSTLCTVPFDTAVRLTGITAVPGLTPERFEARHWPEPAVLAALARADVVF
ncbi:hypothetical protein [Nocardia spumae]|uniref:hypothetical protein n=1 Tax=Nocardia spumae TaxID=2887190 RepID=UPI001D134178|nr:hypothetical protein [Nocardia spumae]